MSTSRMIELSLQQTAFIEYLNRVSIDEIPMPDEAVFKRQRAHITAFRNYSRQLREAYRNITKQTNNLSKQFRSLSIEKIRGVPAQISEWEATAEKAENERKIIQEIHLPDAIDREYKEQLECLIDLESYNINLKPFIKLCNIEKRIRAVWAMERKDYEEVERLAADFASLDPATQNMLDPTCQAPKDVLFRELSVLKKFNEKMESLGKSLAQLDNTVTTRTVQFEYRKRHDIKKALSAASAWVLSFNETKSYVNNRPEQERALLVGPRSCAASNQNGEYEKYSSFASYIGDLSAESKNFFAAADLCERIEQLSSRGGIVDKNAVVKLMNEYQKLNEPVRRYIHERFVSLLHSMSDSSDLHEQITRAITSLEKDFNVFPDAVKNGRFTYAFERYESVCATLSSIEDWLDHYETTSSWLKDGNASAAMTVGLQLQLEKLKSSADRLKAICGMRANINTAHAFEIELVKLEDAVDKKISTFAAMEQKNLSASVREKMALQFHPLMENAALAEETFKKFNALPVAVQDMITTKRRGVLKSALQYHKQSLEIKDSAEKLSKRFSSFILDPTSLRYDRFSLVEQNEMELQDWQKKYTQLRNTADEFKKNYIFFSLDSLRTLADNHKEVASFLEEVEQFRSCYRFYDNIRNYYLLGDRLAYKPDTKEITGLCDTYTNDLEAQRKYKRYDPDGELERMISRIRVTIGAVAKAKNKRVRREKSKAHFSTYLFRYCGLFFALLLLAAIVFDLAKGLHLSGSTRDFYVWMILTILIGAIAGLFFIFDANANVSSSLPAVILFAVTLVYTIGFALPMFLRSTDFYAWYMPWVVLLPIVTTVTGIVIEDDCGEVNMGVAAIYLGIGALELVAVVFLKIVSRFQNSTFLEDGFFAPIANFFIGLWDIIWGLLSGIFQSLLLVIGGGFWSENLYSLMPMSGQELNIILYITLGSALVSFVIGKLKE